MATPFHHTNEDLLPVLRELIAFEPVFHADAFGRTQADFDRRMAPTYWEVGASGRRYSRAFILAMLAKSPPVEANAAGWSVHDEGLQQVGPETYLLTYTLDQAGRLTRRSTIWQRGQQGWRILYHQGTLMTGAADDTAPTM